MAGPPTAQICAKCGKPVTEGKFCTIDTKVYHAACFKCAVCGGSMDAGFCLHKNKYHCKKCFDADVQSNLPKCAACSNTLTPGTKMISAINLHFHEDCFKCADCKEILHSKKVYPIRGKFYCIECHLARKIEAEGLDKVAP